MISNRILDGLILLVLQANHKNTLFKYSRRLGLLVLLRVLEDLDGLDASSDLGMPGGTGSSSGQYLDLPKETQSGISSLIAACHMRIL